MTQRLSGFLLAFLFLFSPVQADVMNVLYLNGNGSYVHLPAQITAGKTGATIETWVKWERIQKWARVYDFGRKGNAAVLQNEKDSSTLNFSIYDQKSSMHRAQKKKAIEVGQWVHIASVSGKNGMALYINGELAASEAYTGSLSEVSGGMNYIGKSNWPDDQSFHGYVAEFRVWDISRAQQEIRQTMYTQLKGDEDHLIAYWRFDGEANGEIKDVSPNGNDAVLKSGAAIMKAPGPPLELVVAAVLPPPATTGEISTSAAHLGSNVMGYKMMLKTALQDAKINESERQMLESVRLSSGISETDAQMMEGALKKELGFEPANPSEETYVQMLKTAVSDDQISESETAMLNSMQTTLNIPDARAQVLRKAMGVAVSVAKPTPKKALASFSSMLSYDEFRSAYTPHNKTFLDVLDNPGEDLMKIYKQIRSLSVQSATQLIDELLEKEMDSNSMMLFIVYMSGIPRERAGLVLGMVKDEEKLIAVLNKQSAEWTLDYMFYASERTYTRLAPKLNALKDYQG